MTKVRFSARAETAVPIMTIAIVAIAHDGTRMPWLACVGSGGIWRQQTGERLANSLDTCRPHRLQAARPLWVSQHAGAVKASRADVGKLCRDRVFSATIRLRPLSPPAKILPAGRWDAGYSRPGYSRTGYSRP